MSLEQKIEAILFYKAAPVGKTELARLCNASTEAVAEALHTLHGLLEERALCVIETDTHVQLVTAPDASELIESVRKGELSKDIGKAGAETLAIILYRGPINRARIDAIRGVNSNFIIRNLLTRGLIERTQDPQSARSFCYIVTPRFYEHLGISRKEELPRFVEIMDMLDVYEREQGEHLET